MALMCQMREAVHLITLTLHENQRVRFTEKAGQKGPEADGIEVV
jgi:cold shock CspA family protein